jgi:uncharacterized membrane protein
MSHAGRSGSYTPSNKIADSFTIQIAETKYFLQDNENAIKIQIYCVLMAFSNLVSFCKIHLFNYINLMRFLEIPEEAWIIDKAEQEKLTFKC